MFLKEVSVIMPRILPTFLNVSLATVSMLGCGRSPQPESPQTNTPPTTSTPHIESSAFGEMEDGTAVEQFVLTNSHGTIVTMISYGAHVTAVEVPDRDGKLANITLGLETLEDYVSHAAYFGSTVGRYANRIANGRFGLDGTEYQLAQNNDENHLHGGIKSFDKVVWNAEPIESSDAVGVRFTHHSANGEENYPGNLEVNVIYTLTEDNELEIAYTATVDQATIVNLTNHCYWNLTGDPNNDVLDHELMLTANRYLATTPDLIPTGELLRVEETAFDFTEPTAIGARIAQLKKKDGPNGYDHCYSLRGQYDELSIAARVKDPASGRVMEIHTTQPGIQFYTGNFLDGDPINGGYKQHAGFCLETQHYPDSPNHEAFPSTCLRPGETYYEVTVHRFSVE